MKDELSSCGIPNSEMFINAQISPIKRRSMAISCKASCDLAFSILCKYRMHIHLFLNNEHQFQNWCV